MITGDIFDIKKYAIHDGPGSGPPFFLRDAHFIAGGATTLKVSRKKTSGFSGATVVSTAGNVKSPALKMPLPALKKPFCGMHRVAYSVRVAPGDALPGR